MLEKERFLEIKEIANKIRKENEELFASLSRLSLEEAIKEKEDFIEAVINRMEIKFTEGELGKEERQIFRANVLIPDDIEFFQTYSKDKNIRNLMNKYLVNIEDIMSKITELNIYGKYNDIFNSEKEDFVEEMVKERDVRDEAMDLLDEIKSLTNDIDNVLGEMETPIIQRQTLEVFTTPLDEIEEIEEVEIEPEEELNLLEPEEITTVNIEIEEKPKEPLVEKTENPDLHDMSIAVASFVDRYSDLESQNIKLKNDMDKLQIKLSELSSALENAENKVVNLEKENTYLKEENTKLSTQALETKAIISKIYSCITPKQ